MTPGTSRWDTQSGVDGIVKPSADFHTGSPMVVPMPAQGVSDGIVRGMGLAVLTKGASRLAFSDQLWRTAIHVQVKWLLVDAQPHSALAE